MPENYEVNLKLFKFIIYAPTDWQETVALNAAIGNYLTIARKDRSSKNWYMGSATDEQGRIFNVPLIFLTTGKKYLAEIYKDGKDTDWRTNPYSIEILEEEVTSSSVLKIRLAPGGGMAVKFKLVE